MTINLQQWPTLGLLLLLGLASVSTHAAGPVPPSATNAAASAAASAAATAAGENCDVLRNQIESRIAAAGVMRFSVRIADADAQVDTGRVVGTCGRGSRKIVYDTQVGPAASPILTECRDGSTPTAGACKP